MIHVVKLRDHLLYRASFNVTPSSSKAAATAKPHRGKAHRQWRNDVS